MRMRRMVLDSDITPVEVIGDWWCDFCGEQKICVAGARKEVKVGTRIVTLADAGICYDCATQASGVLQSQKRIRPDGQMEV